VPLCVPRVRAFQKGREKIVRLLLLLGM
jgi:hypothetical protein